MKWYGLKKIFPQNLTNRKLKYVRLFKKSSFKKNNRIGYKYFTNLFYLPANWNFILSKKNNKPVSYLYIYSIEYFFILPFIDNFLSLKYDTQLNCFVFIFFLKNNYYSIFWNYFKLLFSSFSKIFFKKLKFKGKGYYIYKNTRNTIALQFGYSHLMYLYCFFINVKFLSKTSVLMFWINVNDIFNKSYSFFNIKKINIFTGKGIRFSKQLVYKKTGKVSSYR